MRSLPNWAVVPARERKERIALVEGLELLDITSEVEEVAAIYIERFVMPNDPTGDALHLALASSYKADVLLTWNCQHLANPNKMEPGSVTVFGADVWKSPVFPVRTTFQWQQC